MGTEIVKATREDKERREKPSRELLACHMEQLRSPLEMELFALQEGGF